MICKMNEIKKQITENGENSLTASGDEKSSRKKKDACYFCGKTFVKIETHLLHHTNETEIMDINKLRADSEEQRAIFSELIRKGNTNYTEKQFARLSAILNVSETDVVPLGRPTRSNTKPANYMLCPNCQNVYFKSQILTHYATCLQSGHILCAAVDDDTKEKQTNSDKEEIAKKDDKTYSASGEEIVEETVSDPCAQGKLVNMVEEAPDYSTPEKIDDLVETEKRNPEELADASAAEEKSALSDNSASIRIDDILCKLEDDSIRSIVRDDPTILRFVDIELSKHENDTSLLNDLVRQIWCLARYLNIFKDVVQNEELKLIDTFHVTDEKTVSKVINICCSKFEDRKDLHVLKSAFEKIIESLKVRNKESPAEMKSDVVHSSSLSSSSPPPYSTELKTENDNFTLQAEEDSLGEIPNSNFEKVSFVDSHLSTNNSMDIDEMNVKEWAEDEMDPLMVEDENPIEEEEEGYGENLEKIKPSASIEHTNVPSNKYEETNTKKETSLNLPVTSELDNFNMYMNNKLSFWTQAEIGSCEEYRELCK